METLIYNIDSLKEITSYPNFMLLIIKLIQVSIVL